jgi:hypothetical protein
MNGHPKFYDILNEMGELHSRKNADYATNDNPLGNFDRVAKLIDEYDILKAPCDTNAKVALIYMLKQFDCFMHALGTGKELKVEGLQERLEDITVYSILIRILLDEGRKNTSTNS